MVLVSEWQETGNSRRKRPALLPPSKQLWGARFPNLSRSPPATIHLPVKFRVRAKLQKRLVIKVGLWLGQGIFGLIRQLFNYQVSPLSRSFLQDPWWWGLGPEWSHLGCFSEMCLPTLDFESQPFEAQGNRASNLHWLLLMVFSAILRPFFKKTYFTAVL